MNGIVLTQQQDAKQTFSQTSDPKRRKLRHARPYQFAHQGQGRKCRLRRYRLKKMAGLVESYASKHGSCWAALETLSAKFGLSRRQTSRYLRELAEMGIVPRNGLSHQRGSRVRTIDASMLAKPPQTAGAYAHAANAYGLKKSPSYRPLYAGGVRESDTPKCANLAHKYFLKKLQYKSLTTEASCGSSEPIISKIKEDEEKPSSKQKSSCQDQLKDRSSTNLQPSQDQGTVKVSPQPPSATAKPMRREWQEFRRVGMELAGTDPQDHANNVNLWRRRRKKLSHAEILGHLLEALDQEQWRIKKKGKLPLIFFADFLEDDGNCEIMAEVKKLNALSEEEQRRYWENQRLQRGAT